jgi:hypothetical protein
MVEQPAFDQPFIACPQNKPAVSVTGKVTQLVDNLIKPHKPK